MINLAPHFGHIQSGLGVFFLIGMIGIGQAGDVPIMISLTDPVRVRNTIAG